MINFPLLAKISEVLSKNNFEYIVIGGQAVLVYGVSRFTDDIDILVNSDISKLDDLNRLIDETSLIKLKDDDFTKKTFVIPLYESESEFRIDIIFSFSEFEKEAIKRAKSEKVNETIVKFASVEDIIIMKLFAGRAIDTEDVKKIIIKNIELDNEYILKWLNKFDQDPELNLTKMYKNLIK